MESTVEVQSAPRFRVGEAEMRANRAKTWTAREDNIAKVSGLSTTKKRRLVTSSFYIHALISS